MFKTKHPIAWFEERAGKTIERNGRSFKIPNKESVQYCYQLQGEGFTFADKIEKLRITVMPDTICTACEG